MNTTHPDNATTWRDLADQLTPKQLASVEKCETRFTAGGIIDDPRTTAALMDIARDYATGNVTDAAFSDVPVPPGADVDGDGWTRNLDQPGFSRFLLWRSIQTNVDDASIDIGGRQQTDGSYTRDITLYAENPELTADQARALAAALIEAADELDRLSLFTDS